MGKRFFRNLIAIAIILLGILLVLENLDLVTWSVADWWHYIYPSFFIILGLKWFYQAFKGLNGFGTPVFLIVFGTLLILGQLNQIVFSFSDIYKLWPLILIFLGLYFLGVPRKKKVKLRYEAKDSNRNTATDTDHQGERENIFVGDYDYSSANWKVEPVNLWNVVGNHSMDFTKAFIPDENTAITIHGLAGNINIILPEHIDFSIKATAHAGTVILLDQTSRGINRTLNYETPGYEAATRKLTFNLKLNAGEIRVDRI